MKEKIKCKKCGLLIDDDLETCPYCGYSQKDDTETHPIENKNEEIKEAPNTKSHSFFSFPSRTLDISITKSIVLFLFGLIGLKFIGLLFELISITTGNLYFINNIEASAAINFSSYAILFGAFLIILNFDLDKFYKSFKSKTLALDGIGFGFFLMIVSSAVTLLFRFFDTSTGSNANEQGVDAITDIYPVLSLLIFGIIGPICEELTYRAGLFTAIKKYNRTAAYIVTAIIFGLIHFDFGSIGGENFVSELINIPSYIVSGLLLCYFYDYKGIGVSTVAHVTNNFIAILVQILSSALLWKEY